MNAVTFHRMMDLSVEYLKDGSKMKRQVKAGRTYGKEKTKLLVETEDENGHLSRQWVDMKFFESWLSQTPGITT